MRTIRNKIKMSIKSKVIVVIFIVYVEIIFII